MSLNHGINTYKGETNFSTVKQAKVSIPFFIGAWPCHTGDGFKGIPQIAYSFPEAEKMGGYSSDWRDSSGKPLWSLCQAMYSHFKLFTMSPAIFYNVFDPSKHKKAVDSATVNVEDHAITLSRNVINDNSLIIQKDATVLAKGTDYEVYYTESNCYIELIKNGSAYDETSLSVAYNEADISSVTAADIEIAVEKVEMCKSLFGIVPDLICAPGWSQNPTVAAVMDAKAASINGLNKAKAVVDLDSSASKASDYSKVLAYKNENGYTSKNEIVCWPLAKVGDYIFDLSVIVVGLMANVDSNNDGCPFESPSNKSLTITGACNAAGEEITLSLPQADVVSYTAGVVTVINNGGWVLWGNYTGCWPSSTDVAECFICTNRVQDWICNTFVDTFWGYVDKPATRIVMDAICNSFNSWLNGLTHEGKLYGGEIRYVPDNNPTANVIGGKFRLDTKMASPIPMQQIDMYTVFDVDYLTAALSR